MTICFCESYSALNVWKNSVCVPSLPAMNWMSSTSRTSTDAIALAEIEDAIVAHRVDHLVHESLGRDVGELQIAIVHAARSDRSACIRCVLPSPTPP